LIGESFASPSARPPMSELEFPAFASALEAAASTDLTSSVSNGLA